ncbi:MAG: STAS domain-containing protein [Thermoleophilia bacterium]
MGSRLNIPQLTLERFERDGLHVIALRGELDLRAAGELEAALVPLGDAARVCLDLTELEFIDSTGLATVIRAHQSLAAGGGALAVACRDEGSVRRTFETTGLMTLLTVAADRAGALQALG